MLKVLFFILSFSWTPAWAQDICVERLKGVSFSEIAQSRVSKVRHAFSTVLSPIETFRELPASQIRILDRHAKWGRLFEVRLQSQKILHIWMLPYSNNKACVIREIVDIDPSKA